MYSEFDQVFSLGMSTVQLFASQKDSNPVQKDSLSNSTLEFTPTSQIPSPEADKDSSKGEGNVGAEGERRSPTLLPPSSSSSCSSEEVAVKDDSVEVAVKKEEEETDQGKDGSNHGDDDGYHTPTSPRHRIPEIRVCPPAPKKPANLLYVKRKMRASQARRRIDVEGEIGSFWGAELDDAGPKAKKPRGEATNA